MIHQLKSAVSYFITISLPAVTGPNPVSYLPLSFRTANRVLLRIDLIDVCRSLPSGHVALSSDRIEPIDKLVVDATEDGLPIHKELTLARVNPLMEYTVDGIHNKEVLTVLDTAVGSIILKVKTNDAGALEADFDSLPPLGAVTFKEKPETQNTRDHKIEIKLSGVKDGEYPFRFSGSRANGSKGDQLHDPNIYLLKVDTSTHLVGPISLELDGKTVVISYCLSRDIESEVAVHKATDNSEVLSKKTRSSGTCTVDRTAFAYKMQPNLAEFVQDEQPAQSDGGAGQQNAAQPSSGAQFLLLQYRNRRAKNVISSGEDTAGAFHKISWFARISQ